MHQHRPDRAHEIPVPPALNSENLRLARPRHVLGFYAGVVEMSPEKEGLAQPIRTNAVVNDHGGIVADPPVLAKQPMNELNLLFSIETATSVPKIGLESTEVIEELTPEPHAGADDPTRGHEWVFQ